MKRFDPMPLIVASERPAGAPPAGGGVATFETEARGWCRDRGIDPDGSAPGIMVGPLGFRPEKYWIRRARHVSIAEEARLAAASLTQIQGRR
jgi:hypothetical protein